MEERLEAIFASYKGKKSELISIMQDVQEELGYLPGEAMQQVARFVRLPESRVFGVATFYAHFHLHPRGEHIIRLCCGTACHVRGSSKVSDKIQDVLKVQVGQTTEDMKFTFEEVACIGACALAPVMLVNDEAYGRLTPDKVGKVLKEVGGSSELGEKKASCKGGCHSG